MWIAQLNIHFANLSKLSLKIICLIFSYLQIFSQKKIFFCEMYYNSSYLCSIKLTKENMKSIRKKIENIVKQINDNMKNDRIIVCEKRSGYNTYISSSTGVLLVHYGSAKETLDNLSKMVQ